MSVRGFVSLRFVDCQLAIKLKILEKSGSIKSLPIANKIADPFLPPLFDFLAGSIICFIKW